MIFLTYCRYDGWAEIKGRPEIEPFSHSKVVVVFEASRFVQRLKLVPLALVQNVGISLLY